MTAQPISSMRELHARFAAGIDVRLLLCPDGGRTVVAVVDMTTGDAFHVDVRDDERAMDVFHHPYAHAGWRGIRTRSERAAVAAGA
jgi:hypothetical protein